jgi:hypothetical protein
MNINKTDKGYDFTNLNVIRTGEELHLLFYYKISDLIKLMSKSFTSSEFIVDFGLFWYIVDEADITCIMLNEYPKAIKNIKELNLEIKHCTEVFANCGYINKIKYDRVKYKKLFNSYNKFLVKRNIHEL